MIVDEILNDFRLLACNEDYRSSEVVLEVGGRLIPVDRVSLTASMSSTDKKPAQTFCLHGLVDPHNIIDPLNPKPSVNVFNEENEDTAVGYVHDSVGLTKALLDSLFYYTKGDPVVIRKNRKLKRRFSGMTGTITSFGQMQDDPDAPSKYIFYTPELLAFVGAPLRSSEKVWVNVSDFKNMLFDITDIELLPGFVDDHVEIISTGERGIIDGFSSRQTADGDYELVCVSVRIIGEDLKKKDYALVAFDDIKNLTRPALSKRYRKFIEIREDMLNEAAKEENEPEDAIFEVLDPDGDAVCDPRYP